MGTEELESKGQREDRDGSLPWKSLLIDRWPQGQAKGRSLWPRAWAGCERIRAHKLGRVRADTQPAPSSAGLLTASFPRRMEEGQGRMQSAKNPRS